MKSEALPNPLSPILIFSQQGYGFIMTGSITIGYTPYNEMVFSLQRGIKYKHRYIRLTSENIHFAMSH